MAIVSCFPGDYAPLLIECLSYCVHLKYTHTQSFRRRIIWNRNKSSSNQGLCDVAHSAPFLQRDIERLYDMKETKLGEKFVMAMGLKNT